MLRAARQPHVDVDAAEGKQLLHKNRAAARRAAGRSMVLLKNDGPVLPVGDSSSVTAGKQAFRVTGA